MKIFVYVPGMPFDGNTLKEGKSLGGSETMGYYIAEGLAARDHSVFCFCNVPDGQHHEIDGVHYMPIGESSQQFPFGVNFEKYAKDVPCDVILGQRNPGLFAKPYNSKVNMWWTHDLALKRFQPHINAQLWNIDRILGVSKFHVDQIKNVYGIKDDFLGVLPNGINLALWENRATPEKKKASKIMLYSSRPERGLENLVKPGGIMERLYEIDPEIRLAICGYDNTTPEMQEYYQQLYRRCEELPNVQNMGHLSKQQLAVVQGNCWLHVYPTEFEETSCITAMEQQAAGTPFVCTNVGALDETLKDGGAYFADLSNFEKAIQYVGLNPGKWDSLHRRALKKAQEYDIEKSVDAIEQMIDEEFSKSQATPDQMFHHYFYTSDIAAAKRYAEKQKEDGKCSQEWTDHQLSLLTKRFKTYDQPDLNETVDFYEKSEARNTEIGNKHGMENPANLLRMARLQPIIQALSKLPADSKVLDYGCCVGQVSYALKTAFPEMQFTCVDISEDQVQTGVQYTKDNNIEGMNFYKAVSPTDVTPLDEGFDAIMALEVVEHVWDYNQFLIDISALAKEGGLIMVSTPFGPFEQNSDDPDPLYQHLHNFEERDIKEICEGKPNLSVTYVADQPSKKGECLGNYVWMWNKNNDMFRSIDYSRKLRQTKPRQRVTACMIIRPDGDTLQKCLKSLKLIADDIIVGVDDPEWYEACKIDEAADFVFDKPAYGMLKRAGAKYFPIESPTIQGFDKARNETLKFADGEWIVWVDDDEVYVYGERTRAFLRNSMFDSFGVPQHHFAVEPLGLLKTDYPSRLFRNRIGVRFFGVVHEHPELVYNEGAGKMFLLPPNTGCLMHNAYDTEATRRRRFIRNFGLMERDRKEFPDRKLGQFLWIRDLAHMNRFEYEQIGRPTQQMLDRAREAVDLWRSILPTSPSRMASESMQYITECVNMLTNGGGYEFRMALDLSTRGVGDSINHQVPLQESFSGKVETKQDLLLLQSVLIKEKADSLETINYF